MRLYRVHGYTMLTTDAAISVQRTAIYYEAMTPLAFYQRGARDAERLPNGHPVIAARRVSCPSPLE